MTKFLLDTNVISELRKRDRADLGVRNWAETHADAELWLSVLVVGELRRGVELLRRRDRESASVLEEWLSATVGDFGDRILPVTVGIALRWATIALPDPLPLIDGLLAATALEHDLTLVTRNVNDVMRSGVPVLNPFSSF